VNDGWTVGKVAHEIGKRQLLGLGCNCGVLGHVPQKVWAERILFMGSRSTVMLYRLRQKAD
jgi:hypothetical protein